MIFRNGRGAYFHSCFSRVRVKLFCLVFTKMLWRRFDNGQLPRTKLVMLHEHPDKFCEPDQILLMKLGYLSSSACQRQSKGEYRYILRTAANH